MSKKKILFIGKRSEDDISDGVEKKLTSQIDALVGLGYEVDYTFFSNNTINLISNEKSIKEV